MTTQELIHEMAKGKRILMIPEETTTFLSFIQEYYKEWKVKIVTNYQNGKTSFEIIK